MALDGTETLSAMGQAAVALAKRGVCVFPCDPRTKQPKIDGGLHAATKWVAQVAFWWTHHPTAMIGARTGKKSGFWAVDLDVGDDKDGFAVWRELCAAHGGEPGTAYQDTPSGGRHFLFAWSDKLKVGNSASKLGPGVDTRGEGGYVIIAPSVRADGKQYTYSRGRKVLPAPDWLIEALAAPRPDERALSERADPRANGGRPPPPKGDRAQAHAETALTNELRALRTCAKGGRNNQLNTSAFNLGQLVGAGRLDRSQVEAELEHAAQFCGLVASDGINSVRATIASGVGAGVQKPRQFGA